MSESERRKKLMETIKQFNKDHKSEVFSLGNEIEELSVIPSGVEKIDNFLGGGFKNGAHTIIWGQYSVGKTALVLTTIANAQKLGKLVCFVNTEKPIDPQRFEFFGINLEDMLYIEAPENAEKALEAMRTLCKEKVIDLFIIDSLNGLCPKSVQEEKGKERSLEKKNVASLPLALSDFYNRVNAHVFRSRAAVIWVGQGRIQGIGTYFTRMGLSGGNAQEFYAYQIIFMRKDQNANNPKSKFKEYFVDPNGKLRYATKTEDVGFGAVLKLTKNNCSKAKEYSELIIPYYRESGFHEPKEVNEDDIPVTIDPTMSTEDQEKTIQLLKEKGIKLTSLETVTSDDLIKDAEKSNRTDLEKEVDEELILKGKDVIKDFDNKESIIVTPKKKSKRGRPKKNG